MIKLIFLFAFLLPVMGLSQSVNGVPIDSIKTKYVEIVGTQKVLSNKIIISLNFGQENKAFSTKSQKLVDKTGAPLTFNSMIDALNFMGECGYEFIFAYVVSVGNQSVYHYLLGRE